MRLGTNRTWKGYSTPVSARNGLLCFSMAVFFMSSTVIYGAAVGMLGKLGPALGWPVYMTALILGNNFWGWFTGEWKGVSGVPVRMMFAGVGLQVAGIALLGLEQ
jgi:L-rhamnose-H+ transport protein